MQFSINITERKITLQEKVDCFSKGICISYDFEYTNSVHNIAFSFISKVRIEDVVDLNQSKCSISCKIYNHISVKKKRGGI